MTSRLPSVLTESDLPAAELSAARLDGELFRIGDWFAPVDEIEQPGHRARALRAGLPDRLIAEQATAAWIWGAVASPPTRHQLCVAVGARVRLVGYPWLRVREVVIDAAEVVTIDGMQVTTILRTIVDLARFSDQFDARERSIALNLLEIGALGVTDVIDEINRRRNLPGKRLAIGRLAGV